MFQDFILEAKDPTYYQTTFYFTILISMTKDMGGSRDETKNDIRALPEVLTVTLMEPEKGGIQRDIGSKYLSTLKIHVRKPKDVNKKMLMRKIILYVNNLRGVGVLRYKESQPKPRRKAFHGQYKITEGEYYQSPTHKRDLQQAEKELTQTGPNKGGPLTNVTDEADWESAPPGAPGGLEEAEPEEASSLATRAHLSKEERLYEDLLIKVGPSRESYLAFDVQHELQPKLWKDSEHLYPGVRGALEEIVEEFLENLGLDIDVADIIVTGSIANYNWSQFSDIDVHILVDFSEINEDKELVKRFFDAVRSNWNKLHDIHVKGHEVELYVQDVNEPHVSTGVYSLPDQNWLVVPKKVEPQIDKATSLKKMKSLAREIDKLSKVYDNSQYEEAFKLAERIKRKIKRMRRSGLERTGIYSPENLAFKMLRRSGDIEQLFAIYTQAYDQIHSLDQ